MQNTKEVNWGADIRRAPEVKDGETIVFSECGRSLNNVCYRSHYFRIVKPEFGPHELLVKHGGGQERFSLGYGDTVPSMISTLGKMDSDTRYLAIYLMYDIRKDAGRHATAETAAKYERAFVDGKLKKRKLPRQGRVKVWIESNNLIQ